MYQRCRSATPDKLTTPPALERVFGTWIEDQVLGQDEAGEPGPQAGRPAFDHRPRFEQSRRLICTGIDGGILGFPEMGDVRLGGRTVARQSTGRTSRARRELA